MSTVENILARLRELRQEVEDLEQALLRADRLDPVLGKLVVEVEAELGVDAARWWTSAPPDMLSRSPREIATRLSDHRAVRGLLRLPGAHERQ